MNSVWYDMGIRDGNFTGVLPSRFLNAAYRFFFELYMRSHQSLEPEWKPWDFEKRDKFKFNGLRKWDMDGDERQESIDSVCTAFMQRDAAIRQMLETYQNIYNDLKD